MFTYMMAPTFSNELMLTLRQVGMVFLGLVATGYRCAFWSPWDTTTCEAGIAGLITLVFLMDVFALVLGMASILTYGWMGLVLAVGLAGTFLGGYLRDLT